MADEEQNQGNLKEEDENILLWATLGISFGIDIFITRIEREIALLRNAGISNAAIIDIPFCPRDTHLILLRSLPV